MEMKSSASRIILSAILLGATGAPLFAQTVNSSAGDEVKLLKEQLANQQTQIEQLRASMEDMKRRLDQSSKNTPAAPPQTTSVVEVASTTPVVPAATAAAPDAVAVPVASPPAAGVGRNLNQQPSSGDTARSPLEFRMGNAVFKVGGFVDATSIFRSTNVGSGIGTSFGAIPFAHTTAGSLTETRFSPQSSRVSLTFQTPVGETTTAKFYVETDFLGSQPVNAFVTANSDSLRLRLYWAQFTHGKFEFLGGQTWSLFTPSRNALRPEGSEVFYAQNDMDQNWQVGLTWTRAMEFRFIYHASKEWTAGLALENPQQYVGPAVVLPGASCSASPPSSPSPYCSQVDNGSLTAAPNLAPDIIGKVAYDPWVGGKHMHVEAAGLLRSFKVFTPATAKAPGVTNTATGGGGYLNFNLEVVRDFHLILTDFVSDGGGRYIFGLGPDLIVKPDGGVGLVHAYSGIGGFEWQVNKQNLFYGYYGDAYFQRNTGIIVNPTTGKISYVGFGFPGSPSSSNRTVQESTLGLNQTYWKNPRYGMLQLITQFSYLTRSPWYVAPGTPKNAHVGMVYADIRYTLP